MEIEHLFAGSGTVEPPPLDWDDWDTLVDAGLADVPEPIPADLGDWAPGLFSHAVLSAVDRSALSGHDLVTVLRAEERLIAHLQALQAETIAQLAERSAPDADRSDWASLDWDSTAAELACALRLTRRGGDLRLSRALQLTSHRPLWNALVAGTVDEHRARIVADGVNGLPEEAASQLVSAVVGPATKLTSGQLRARLRRLRNSIDPAGAQTRYEHGLDDRAVVCSVNDDGTANLCGYSLPVDRVAEARDRIERMARSLKRDGETRSFDQLRADVFLDLLCGVPVDGTSAGRGHVDIVVDLETFAGLAENPGEIPGFGPVIADIARQLGFEAGRRWQVTLTREGRPVWAGTTRRRPDTALARQVRARHPRCVFPGCRMPARSCDLDHTHPWAAGGATCEHNLAPLCRHHHELKDKGWSYRLLPDGTIVWTSPLGHTYTTEHPP